MAYKNIFSVPENEPRGPGVMVQQFRIRCQKSSEVKKCTVPHFIDRETELWLIRPHCHCNVVASFFYKPKKYSFVSGAPPGRKQKHISPCNIFFFKSMSAEARMFLILIHIFSNSYPTPTPNTCLKCFTWPKLSFGKFSNSNSKFFIVFEKFSDQIWASMFL